MLLSLLAAQAGANTHYHPEGRSAVTVNGKAKFNRALHGGSRSGFRLECSDTPEFGLYFPRMGGNMMFTLPEGDCSARYLPGRMDYEQGGVRLSALVSPDTDIAIWKLSNNSKSDKTVGIRFGAASDKRFSREGDLGVDPADCFEFTPEKCAGNTYIVKGQDIEVEYGAKERKKFHLILPLNTYNVTSTPSLEGTIDLKPGQTVYAALFAPGVSQVPENQLAQLFDYAEDARVALTSKLVITTPEEWLNPLGGALAVAADAIWSGELWLHGSIGWRTPHLGWRGAYAGDALGNHDRARTHFTTYANNQITDIPPTLPHPRQDSTLCLARAEKRWGTPFYSNGYICRRPGKKEEMSHYDMNLVYIDALLRHLRHTGDTAAMRHFFPVIARHLDWEKRNFDPDGDHLYDGYACIWASDALYYTGGAATHSTAYNLLANKLMARVADIIGEDATPYRREAEAIGRAMDSALWMPQRGHWAEYKDLMGHGRRHPSAAVWTIYHAIDSEVADPFKNYSATCYVDSMIPHIPVAEGLSTISTTNWKPYSWSINNVAIAEVMHTALAFWQAGRPNEAFTLMKAVAQDNMYDGASPLNFGQISQFDAARGECYRDFADPIGVWSRALMEGLYGIRPDLLAEQPRVDIVPGFPSDWDKASIKHSDLSYTFERKGKKATYTFTNTYPSQAELFLTVPVSGEPTVKVNGKKVTAEVVETSIGAPRIRIPLGNSRKIKVEITSKSPLAPYSTGKTHNEGPVTFSQMKSGNLTWWEPSAAPYKRDFDIADGFDNVRPELCEVLDLTEVYNDSVSRIFRNRYLSPRPDVTTLQLPTQGIGEWCHPKLTAEIDDSGLRKVLREKSNRLRIPQGITFMMPADGNNVMYTSLWDNYPTSSEVPLSGQATNIYMVLAGSTNHMQSGIENGRVTVTYTDGSQTALPLVNPHNWAPIEQDFYTDTLAFAQPTGMQPPVRLHLMSGRASRHLSDDLAIDGINRMIPGGAAIVLDMPVDPSKTLEKLSLETLSNDVIIGLMGLTLQRPASLTAWYPVATVNRPFVRWWWHGSAVDDEGLRFNLSEFADKGMGGVEITPIYGVKGNEANDIDYLSPRWMNALRTVEQTGDSLHLQTDMNNGTGWPFGGPEITPAMGAKKLIVETLDNSSGKVRVVPSDAKQRPTARLQRVLAYDNGTTVDLTTQVGADSMLVTPYSPVYAVFCGNTFQKVKRAAPGGEGLVVNHLDSVAVKAYLSKFDKAFGESGVPIPTSFFNDSYEVYGADWTDNIFEEFRADHGYALEDHIPLFITTEASDKRGRVLRDYRYTLARLLEENFTLPWTRWAHAKGATIRNQSHGSPANIIDIYADVDIPECESFGQTDFDIPGLADCGPKRQSDSAPAVLKFASSAAHVAGKPLTSAETLTWLTEHFRTPLSRCKPELDQMFCSGVNHVYFHGAAYSPKDAEFPGRLFYASINMSPTNSLWRHSGHLFDYISRIQAFLAAGEPDNELLLYFPIEDLWHESDGKPYMMFDIHRMHRTMPEVKKAVADIIEAGYDVDYVTDRLLDRLSVNPDKSLSSLGGASGYKAIIVPEAKHITIPTMHRLDSLAREGARVIFAGGYPSSLPGLVEDPAPAEFMEALASLKEHTLAAKDLAEAMQLSQANPEPLRKEHGISYIRRKNEAGGHNYFISLLQNTPADTFIPLTHSPKSVMIFDPMTGKSGMAQVKDGAARIQLQPGQSLMLKTFPGEITASEWQYLTPSGKSVEIADGWTLRFLESAPAIEDTFKLRKPMSWTALPHPSATVNSGTALYSTTFTLPADIKADEWMLDLGDVREVARVRINGREAGTAWAVPFTLAVGKYLKPGKNAIEVEVTSLDANRIADYERRGVKWRVFKDANIASVTNAKTFSFGDWPTLPCGLNSTVSLTPMKSN